MVSHNVEEAVFMADRVVVMSPRPGKVVGEVKIDIPRPRAEYLRESIYFRFVDEVVELLEKGKTKMQDESPLSLIASRGDKP
jgi:NitT/TauT family transport system ATP-binding protein